MNSRWPKTIVTLHWITALIVIGMFASGLWMVDLTYYSDWYKTAPHWHKSVGLILLAATLFRLLIRLRTKRPAPHGSAIEKRLSKVGHAAIYFVLLSLFMSGYLISTADGRAIEVFNWVSVPALGELFENQEDVAGDIHFYLAWTLIGLAVVHALAALKHHFINKDDTMKQMLRLH
ncbi:cytochrome b [Alteromonas sp. MTD1]|uniref:cytochrome b n=1 Tax=Alteromonas sp. MTD1 TaxID=3057962 RepID=UPI0036F41FF7